MMLLIARPQYWLNRAVLVSLSLLQLLAPSVSAIDCSGEPLGPLPGTWLAPVDLRDGVCTPGSTINCVGQPSDDCRQVVTNTDKNWDLLLRKQWTAGGTPDFSDCSQEVAQIESQCIDAGNASTGVYSVDGQLYYTLVVTPAVPPATCVGLPGTMSQLADGSGAFDSTVMIQGLNDVCACDATAGVNGGCNKTFQSAGSPHWSATVERKTNGGNHQDWSLCQQAMTKVFQSCISLGFMSGSVTDGDQTFQMAANFTSQLPTAPSNPVCTSADDSTSNPARSNVVDAGTQLIGYLYDPSRQGQLSLPAQGSDSQYKIDRQAGSSHVTLGPATSGAITAETIILDDVVGAIMRVMTKCTAGSVGIGSGQWAIFVSSDGHVGKRHWKSPNTQAIRSNELLENGLKTRTTVNDRIAQIGVLAAWAVWQMGTPTIGGFYDSRSVVEWSDAEIQNVDAVAVQAQQMFKASSGNSDGLWVAPSGSPYRAYMSLTGVENWGSLESLIITHGGEDTIVKKLLEGCMHNAADRNTMTGAYQWAVADPDTNNVFGQSLNVVVTRQLFSQPDECETCKCFAGNPTSQPDALTDISAASPDFYQNIQQSAHYPPTVGTLNPPPGPSKKRRSSAAESEALRVSRIRRSSAAKPRDVSGDRDISPTIAGSLFKRYRSCDVRYENNNYPSTTSISHLPAVAGSADLEPAIRKWVDWQTINPGLIGVICPFDLFLYPDRVVGHPYATEHVYEKHLLASFFNHMIFNYPGGPNQGGGARAPCAVIDAVFNTMSVAVPLSPFFRRKPSDLLASALSDNNRLAEFYILSSDVNGAKHRILSTSPEFGGVPQILTANSWQEQLRRISQYVMAFRYMNLAEVSTIFAATNTRMRNIMQQIDVDPGYQGPNHRPNPIVDPVDGTTPRTWLQCYDNWLDRFFTYKQLKMQAWILRAVDSLRGAVTASNLTPAQKATAFATITEMSDAGTNGLLSEGRMQFSAVYEHLHP